jgi:hypothetical protein
MKVLRVVLRPPREFRLGVVREPAGSPARRVWTSGDCARLSDLSEVTNTGIHRLVQRLDRQRDLFSGDVCHDHEVPRRWLVELSENVALTTKE